METKLTRNLLGDRFLTKYPLQRKNAFVEIEEAYINSESMIS